MPITSTVDTLRSNEHVRTSTPPPSYSEVQSQPQFAAIPQGQIYNYGPPPIAMGNYPHAVVYPVLMQQTPPPVVYHHIPPPVHAQKQPPIQQKTTTQSTSNSSNDKTINLNLDDLSAVVNRIKSDKNQNFIELNKHIGKNKPLSEARMSLVNNKYLSDVRFTIDGSDVIYAHKLFLTTVSLKFFKHFQVDKNVEMKVESVDRETFLKVLEYCYTSHLTINEDNVSSLLMAADVLEIKQITNICKGFINNKMNPETIFIIFDKAIQSKFEEIQNKCLDYITKNEEKCFNSKGFYEISLPSLMKVLEFCKYSTERSDQLIEKWHQGIHSMMSQPQPTVNKRPPRESTGAVKKTQQNQRQKPQNLVDAPIPSPSTSHPSEFSQFYENLKPTRPFASAMSVENLINFDDDEDISGVICKDDSDDDLVSERSYAGDRTDANTTLIIGGTSQKFSTEFSRIDLISKRPLSITEIWFNENLFASDAFKSIRVVISLCNRDKKLNIHTRTIKNGMKPGEIKNYI